MGYKFRQGTNDIWIDLCTFLFGSHFWLAGWWWHALNVRSHYEIIPMNNIYSETKSKVEADDNIMCMCRVCVCAACCILYALRIDLWTRLFSFTSPFIERAALHYSIHYQSNLVDLMAQTIENVWESIVYIEYVWIWNRWTRIYLVQNVKKTK